MDALNAYSKVIIIIAPDHHMKAIFAKSTVWSIHTYCPPSRPSATFPFLFPSLDDFSIEVHSLSQPSHGFLSSVEHRTTSSHHPPPSQNERRVSYNTYLSKKQQSGEGRELKNPPLKTEKTDDSK